MSRKEHVVKKVLEGSIGEELEIEVGDKVLEIDGTEIEDIFSFFIKIQENLYVKSIMPIIRMKGRTCLTPSVASLP